jgi:hypothetical protein
VWFRKDPLDSTDSSCRLLIFSSWRKCLEYTVCDTVASGSEYCFPDPCFFRRVPVIFPYGNSRIAPEITRLPAGSRPYPETGSFDLGRRVVNDQILDFQRILYVKVVRYRCMHRFTLLFMEVGIYFFRE